MKKLLYVAVVVTVLFGIQLSLPLLRAFGDFFHGIHCSLNVIITASAISVAAMQHDKSF